MNLTIFNKETMPQGTFGTGWAKSPAITIGQKGLLKINYAAGELLDVKEGDRVSIAQDEENPADWYITKDPNGYELRLGSDKKSYLFNNIALSKTIYECFELSAETKSVRWLIAGQPTKVGKQTYFGILQR